MQRNLVRKEAKRVNPDEICRSATKLQTLENDVELGNEISYWVFPVRAKHAGVCRSASKYQIKYTQALYKFRCKCRYTTKCTKPLNNNKMEHIDKSQVCNEMKCTVLYVNYLKEDQQTELDVQPNDRSQSRVKKGYLNQIQTRSELAVCNHKRKECEVLIQCRCITKKRLLSYVRGAGASTTTQIYGTIERMKAKRKNKEEMNTRHPVSALFGVSIQSAISLPRQAEGIDRGFTET